MSWSIKPDADNMALCILIVGEASGVFAGFCPSWFTVSSPFFHEQEAKSGNVKRIRWGEAAATAIVMTTGLAVSYQQKDPIPLIASAVISIVFTFGYEYMIRNPSSMDDKGDDVVAQENVPGVFSNPMMFGAPA